MELVAPVVALLVLPAAEVLAVEEEDSLLAKPLVLPVWLRELLALAEGDVVAEVLDDVLALLSFAATELPVSVVELVALVAGAEVAGVFAALSLAATELLVDGVVLVDEVEELSLLARPLVLAVSLVELVALAAGADVAAVLAAESLAATELLVDGVVLVDEVDAVSLLATALALPVSLDELVDVADGDDEVLIDVLMFVF